MSIFCIQNKKNTEILRDYYFYWKLNTQFGKTEMDICAKAKNIISKYLITRKILMKFDHLHEK